MTDVEPKRIRVILPLGLRVLVTVLPNEERTDSGLYLPAGAKDRHDEAVFAQVIEVARDRPSADDGENVSGIPNGSLVLFKKGVGVRVPWDDSLRLVDVKDILATVDERDEETIL